LPRNLSRRFLEKEIMRLESGGVQRLALAGLLAAAVVSLAATLFFLKQHLTYKQSITESTRARLVAVTDSAASQIDVVLRDTARPVDSLSAELTAGRITKAAALDRLRELVGKNPHTSGGTVTYRPFGYSPERRLYSAYFVRKPEGLRFVELDTAVDYTRPEYEWYGLPMEQGALWTEPYWDEVAERLMVTYSAPFYESSSGQRRALGVVTADIALDEIRHIIEAIDLGPSGFGALVSAKGVYLYHPVSSHVIERKTLLDLAREGGDQTRQLLAEKASRRESGVLDHLSTTTGLASWLIFTPVPSTGWSLQNTFIKEDMPLEVRLLRQQVIRVVLAAVLFLCFLAAVLAGAHTGRVASAWAVSIIWSLLFAAAVGVLWRISLTHDPQRQAGGVKVNDIGSLRHVMEQYRQTCERNHTEPPQFVPTGVYIESAYFSGTSELTLTGYVWQKYRKGAQDHLTRGFVIGAASNVEVSENYRAIEKDTEVVRWQFSAVLHIRLDHSRYPLEQNVLSIRLAHRDLNHNVVLIPDLAGYKLTNPTSLPGLERDLALTGWKVDQSFFELRRRDSGTNFGFEKSLSKENFPSLYFNVVVMRVFSDAFISNLTPLIIISILLFTLIMIASRDERLVGFMQAGAGRILNICAAMFFVIAFSHIDTRRRLGSEEIFYLEYFYFLTYVNILWVSVNSVLFAMGNEIRIIQYRENLIAKLFYWPFLLGVLLMITVAFFY
jgi:hypothetical protein